MNRAMTLAQACWNLALLPEGQRGAAIDELKPALDMSDEEFAEFRQEVILPMIRRHREVFPQMHARSARPSNTGGGVPSPTQQQQARGRNTPCPCGSGRKYKRCCGARK